jgi:ABC-type antimicrobial peptide transport system permease subunit
VSVRGGVSAGTTAKLKHALAAFPDLTVRTRADWVISQGKSVNQILDLFYVLLALSVIVSLFGMVNTLVLAVFERTRELGMLRAIGMTRRQMRRMIRYESIVTALMGAALGMAVGIFLAFLITRALSSQGIVFAVPWMQLVYFVIAAIVVGVLAAIFPARRAARLNVLEALQYE